MNLRSRARLLHPAAGRRSTELPHESLAALIAPLVSRVGRTDVHIPEGAQRGYFQLLATASFDVWLIAWKPSASLGLHDHGGSRGLIHVAHGTLSESYMDRDGRTRPRVRHLHAGASVDVPAERIHEVWNAGPHDALSVHAYSPPLETMTFYEPAGRPTEHGAAPLASEPARIGQ